MQLVNVLLINKFLYPRGGDAISTIYTGKILANKGHNVSYWGMHHDDNPFYPLSSLFTSYVDYDSKNIYYKFINLTKILYSFEAKNKMYDVLERINPDIIHLNNFAHQLSPSILDAICRYRIPVAMTMRDYKVVCPSYRMISNGYPCDQCKNGMYFNCTLNRCTKNSYLKSLVNTAEMYLHHNILKCYDKINIYISPSIFLLEKVHEMGFRKKVVHVPNCIDVQSIIPCYDYQENTIIYVGRLSHEKGIETLINAVKRLKSVHLKIVGDGPLKASLAGKLQTENISNVSLLGYKTGIDLFNEIRSSAFLVIPSEWYENNPRTVIEAFALGKPVLGARMGGIPELVHDWETGLTYSSGDEQELREKIHILLDYPEAIKEMGRNGRKMVENELNPDLYYQRLIEVYQNAQKMDQADSK